MKVVFLAPAQNELDDAVAWYNRQAAGLGRELLDELDRAVRRALAFPQSYRKLNRAFGVVAWGDSLMV